MEGGLSMDDNIKKKKIRKYNKKWRMPFISIILLGIIITGCVFCELFMTHDPFYMDLGNANKSPDGTFWFGTDTMGRDIFSMILRGGRISLLIGMTASAISTIIALIYGSFSAVSPEWLDELLMRFTEILLSIPSILLIIFIQAFAGTNNVMTIAVVIGCTSWMSMAKIVRTEVRQIRSDEYVIAARCMGGSFFHNLRWHYIPNCLPSIMFMIVMNIRGAIVSEATLSFVGLGLPLEIISWGSMLSLAEKAVMSNSWWIVFIPGVFLVVTIFCITEIGNYLLEKTS